MNEYTPTPEQLDTLGKVADSVTESESSRPYSYYMLDMLTPAELDPARLVATCKMLEKTRLDLSKDIDASDYRLTHIWEKAGEIAEENGYCSQFEKMMDELGTGYAREAEFEVVVEVTQRVSLFITAHKDSDSADLENYIDEDQLKDAMACQGVRIDNWEIDYINTL